MTGQEMLDALENLDPAYIEAAATPKAGKTSWVKKWGAIAACLALLLSASFGTYAYAAEVREYNVAVQFFDHYDLSTEGLSRKDIKAIYRDITTKTFSYSKTAEVIADSLTAEQIAGYEILQDNPTPEEVNNLWNYKNYNGMFLHPDQKGAHYKYRTEFKDDGEIHFDRSYFEKYDEDTLVWSVSFTEFLISGYSVVSDGVIAYGRTDALSSCQNTYSYVAKLDGDGNFIWKRMLNNGFRREYIAAVLENGDGSYAVMSRGDSNYFCLSQYTPEGKEIHFKKTEIGNYRIQNAARFDDGYIVQLGNYTTGGNAKIAKVDCEGNITESFLYSSEDHYYYITDMIEFNGNIYLSAYAVPKLYDENQSAGGRYEIANILNYLCDNHIWKISSEELTPMVRDNYTAMLLVCDPNTGIPQEFYSAKGSIGGKIAVSDSGRLLWDVESITTTFFSPATSSFTIGGTCSVFRYTFDDVGRLLSQEKTGEVTNFRR